MAITDYPDFEQFTLGQQHEPVEVDSSEAIRAASLALIGSARREIVMLSRHLDPSLYDNSETSTALRGFVLSSRRARVRILVKDPDPPARKGHRVVELAHRVSSFIEVRTPAPEYHAVNAAYLVVDRVGLIYRSLADRYEATVCFADRHTAGDLLRQFEEMWETSRVDPALRRLAM